MLKLLGENIKIHFAGAEQINFSLLASNAGVHYFLFTVFGFISKQFGINGYPVLCKAPLFVPKEIEKISNHYIMDSGLFTLMFGALKGREITKDFIIKWKDALCDFVNSNNLHCTCVETDCQKTVGVAEAWEMRQAMQKQLPNNRIINVFHWEDGKRGLESLIDYSEYIAISVPELRIIKGKTYKEDVYAMASYIKSRKPEIDIHLLGCTERGLLERCTFCTTSDSTSWLAANRFGSINGKQTSQLKKSVKENYYSDALRVLDYCGYEATQKRIDYYANVQISAEIHKKRYTQWCGNQD